MTEIGAVDYINLSSRLHEESSRLHKFQISVIVQFPPIEVGMDIIESES